MKIKVFFMCFGVLGFVYSAYAQQGARIAVMLSGPYAGRKIIVLSSGEKRRFVLYRNCVVEYPQPVAACELVFRILQWNLIKAGKKIDAQKIEEYKQRFKQDVAVLPEYELQKTAVLEKQVASKVLKNERRLRTQQQEKLRKNIVRFDMGKNYARQGKPIQQITGGR